MWLWVAGDGLRRLPGDPIDPLMEYVDLLACRIEIKGETPPDTEYQIGRMTAGEREDDASGAGGSQCRAPAAGWGGCRGEGGRHSPLGSARLPSEIAPASIRPGRNPAESQNGCRSGGLDRAHSASFLR